MRISDWSSDVCSSDLFAVIRYVLIVIAELIQARKRRNVDTKADTVAWYGADDLTRIALIDCIVVSDDLIDALHIAEHVEASMHLGRITGMDGLYFGVSRALPLIAALDRSAICLTIAAAMRSRSEEHTSALQSLMRISYAVFGLKKKKLK